MRRTIRNYFNCWSAPKPSYEALKEIYDILTVEGLIQQEEKK